MPENLLTVSQLTEITGFSRNYISRICKDGFFGDLEKVGRAYVIPKDKAVEFFEGELTKTQTRTVKLKNVLAKLQ